MLFVWEMTEAPPVASMAGRFPTGVDPDKVNELGAAICVPKDELLKVTALNAPPWWAAPAVP
jgi:hypothetical protein